MERIIISIHSFVDVITNSSTELFICDTDKSVETVRDIVYAMEKKWPNEYGHKLSVDAMNPDDWRIGEICNFYGEEAEAVKYLEMKGYKVEKPTTSPQPRFIEISAERGGLDPRLKSFIEEHFNVIHYDFES